MKMDKLNSNFENLPKLVVILGPTASGKSRLAIKLAQEFKGEIVSADSRQIYKGMNIGTGKTTKKEMQGIPHHLIDIIYPNQEFNVAVYKKLAFKIIKDIRKRKKIPFLVGGTGLYLQAIVENIKFPRIKPRKKLRKELEKKEPKELFEIYKKLDPKGARFIEKENKRRLIRAIEVSETTKKPFWEQRKKGKPIFDVLQIGIKLPKEELEKKISQRVDKMIKAGLQTEVRNLVKKYGWIPILQTIIGYQEWRSYLENKINKEEVKKLIIQHTIQFAKRQLTWFKRFEKIYWTPPARHPYKWAKKLVKEFLEIKKGRQF